MDWYNSDSENPFIFTSRKTFSAGLGEKYVTLSDGFIHENITIPWDESKPDLDPDAKYEQYLHGLLYYFPSIKDEILQAIDHWKKHSLPEIVFDSEGSWDIFEEYAQFEELSPEWYLTKIYIEAKVLWYIIHELHKGVDLKSETVKYIAEYSMNLGALSREYRLSLQNKQFVVSAINRRFALDDYQKATSYQHNAARKKAAESWRAVARKIASSSKLTGGALEKHIQRELERRGFEPKMGRSIRRALQGMKRKPE